MYARVLFAFLAGSALFLGSGPVSAQLGRVPGRDSAPQSAPRDRAARQTEQSSVPGNQHRSPGGWGGPGCAKASDLVAIVDRFLAAANPEFPQLGSPIAGASMAWRSRDCGSFTYVAGLRNVERQLPMTPAARMSTGSMTKVVLSAVTLRLMEQGVFGKRGLDSKVDKLLPPGVIRALTVGDDPANPRCPGETYFLNRLTGAYEWKAFDCPDLSRVSLRDLMISNHGMYDFINEDALPDGTSRFWRSVFPELHEYIGFPPLDPMSSRNGFDYLAAFGLKHVIGSTIGGTGQGDFEVSFGNTGFQLLAIILEHRTGKRLDVLIRELITEPLGIEPMEIYVRPQSPQSWADGYYVNTGNPDIEQSGIHPLTDINGHTAINVRNLGAGRPANVNMAGGAGGLIATPRAYAAFLDAFTNGRLLGRTAQRELETSYLSLVEFPDYHLWNGLGLIKEITRGFPGAADAELLSHGGHLPGARCDNAVVKRLSGKSAQFTGVLCVNSSGPGIVDPRFAWYDLINVIADPATYGSP